MKISLNEAVQWVKNFAKSDYTQGYHNSFTAAIVAFDNLDTIDKQPYTMLYLRMFYEIEHMWNCLNELTTQKNDDIIVVS